jgi:hypothetical protein
MRTAKSSEREGSNTEGLKDIYLKAQSVAASRAATADAFSAAAC